VSGEWTGTWPATENAGGAPELSAALRVTRAEWRGPAGKLFASRAQDFHHLWRSHDMTDNIVHFVLGAIWPDAPAGTKGISRCSGSQNPRQCRWHRSAARNGSYPSGVEPQARHGMPSPPCTIDDGRQGGGANVTDSARKNAACSACSRMIEPMARAARRFRGRRASPTAPIRQALAFAQLSAARGPRAVGKGEMIRLEMVPIPYRASRTLSGLADGRCGRATAAGAHGSAYGAPTAPAARCFPRGAD